MSELRKTMESLRKQDDRRTRMIAKMAIAADVSYGDMEIYLDNMKNTLLI